MFSKAQKLSMVDPEIALQVTQEVKRQEDHIELIASENYTSPAVMEAQGSSSQINTQKDILVSAFMAAVNL